MGMGGYVAGNFDDISGSSTGSVQGAEFGAGLLDNTNNILADNTAAGGNELDDFAQCVDEEPDELFLFPSKPKKRAQSKKQAAAVCSTHGRPPRVQLARRHNQWWSTQSYSSSRREVSP